ncbi:MAG TPA: hypothetical protein PKZ22_04680 [Accumulibacter sp.]|jgi:hypothetical protein|nr:hypothetical protein [Accumulibacter sp.]
MGSRKRHGGHFPITIQALLPLPELMMDAEWVLATLSDAMEALESAVAELESDPESLDERLPELLPAIYAKLNYAWNSRELGPAALEQIDHDRLVAFPRDLPF